MAYHRYHGVKTRIVRIFNTYGPRMRLNDGRVLPNFMGQALRGEPITVYGQRRTDPQLLLRHRPGRGHLPAPEHRLLRAGQPRQPRRDHRLAARPGDHRPGRGDQEHDHLPRPSPGRPETAEARHHPRPEPPRLEPDRRPRRGPEAHPRILPAHRLIGQWVRAGLRASAVNNVVSAGTARITPGGPVFPPTLSGGATTPLHRSNPR